MNTLRIFLITLFILPVYVWAGEVTLPNTFVPGERARADEMNANFAAVKDAVDDNDERITDLENQVGGTGAVTLSAHAFSTATADCVFKLTQLYGYFENTDKTCVAAASISLPDGAKIGDAGCVLYDNVATSSIKLTTIRANINVVPTIISILNSIESTIDEPLFAQTLGMFLVGNPANAKVNNLLYAYSINVVFDTTDLVAHQNLRLHSCIVNYTFGD
jgi:hypothetical protein